MTSRILALVMAVALAHAALAQNATLITTFTNPTPANFDSFGYSMAAVGSDRVLIGAYRDDTGAVDAGAAYIFNTNGTLLTTITNPIPADFDEFGYSMSAVGSDRVLIGAHWDDTDASQAGAAYLFNTNGMLLTTFKKPNPEAGDLFGISVAAVGSNLVLIGAYGDDTGAPLAGAAYLFSTNGTLLTTITNPTPAANDYFGYTVTAVGADRVLIDAHGDNTGASRSGAAYLFSTNGTLLTTFNNPTPWSGDNFGLSMAALGNDRVLIGAIWDDTGAFDAGSAYLFNTNGSLLTTITNPTPAVSDVFGTSVSAVGSDRLLIGAIRDDTGEADAGSVYLFGTNGTLLATLTNPTPEVGDNFGSRVVTVGSDFALISAYRDDTGAVDAGAAYLFALPPVPPTLSIAPASPGNATISWAANTPGFELQETEALSPANWTNSLSEAANPTLAPTTLPAKYFRLRQPGCGHAGTRRRGPPVAAPAISSIAALWVLH